MIIVGNAFAARLWFLVACGALAFCVVQPYLVISAYRSRERVVVLDGSASGICRVRRVIQPYLEMLT